MKPHPAVRSSLWFYGIHCNSGINHQRQLGIIKVYGFSLAVFIGLGFSVDPRSIVQTVGCKDVLVVQQGKTLRRGRGNQRFAYRSRPIRIYQRVTFQIFILHTAASTENCRQRKCYNTQPFPFHGVAPSVRISHNRCAPSRA